MERIGQRVEGRVFVDEAGDPRGVDCGFCRLMRLSAA